MKIFTVVVIFVFIGIGIWSAYGYLSVVDREPQTYSLVDRRDGYEVRRYESAVAIEVAVSGTYREALTRGTIALTEYISGANMEVSKIRATSPVIVEASIGSDSHIFSLFLPKKFVKGDVPTPANKNVIVRTLPSRTFAVLSFSWSNTAETVALKKQELVELLERDGIERIGTPHVALYNTEGTPPFMLHTEIWIPVEF